MSDTNQLLKSGGVGLSTFIFSWFIWTFGAFPYVIIVADHFGYGFGAIEHEVYWLGFIIMIMWGIRATSFYYSRLTYEKLYLLERKKNA